MEKTKDLNNNLTLDYYGITFKLKDIKDIQETVNDARQMLSAHKKSVGFIVALNIGDDMQHTHITSINEFIRSVKPDLYDFPVKPVILIGDNNSDDFIKKLREAQSDELQVAIYSEEKDCDQTCFVVNACTGEKVNSTFAFDIYLQKEMYNNTTTPLLLDPMCDKTVFFSRFKRLCENEYGKSINKPGCKINWEYFCTDAMIYIDRFYEVELLYHDTYFIYCMAFIIAFNLFKQSKRNTKKLRHSIIIGFEKYSSLLIHNIIHILKCNGVVDLYGGFFIEEKPNKYKINFFGCEPDKCTQYNIITILNVGTTLSTICRLHELLDKNNLKSGNKKKYNFVLLLIKEEDPTKKYSSKYWKDDEEIQKLSLVNTANKKYGNIIYLHSVNAKWTMPSDDERDNRDIVPVVTIGASYSTPEIIFDNLGANKNVMRPFIRNCSENTEKVKALSGHIKYGHIRNETNHFQFLIDYESYYEKNKASIIAFLKNEKKQYASCKSEKNIIICPQHIKNSAFLDSVIREVFEGNVSVIYIDVMSAHYDDIRSEYSYIMDRHTDIHVYYVDWALTEWQTFSKANTFIKMVLNEEPMDIQDIILLANFCTEATAIPLIAKPISHLKAYMHLGIPQYNINEARCISCNRSSRLELLRKRSSTDLLSKEFEHAYKENNPSSESGYDSMLEHEILYKHSYFEMLKQYIYINSPEYLYSKLPLTDGAKSTGVEQRHQYVIISLIKVLSNMCQKIIDAYISKYAFLPYDKNDSAQVNLCKWLMYTNTNTDPTANSSLYDEIRNRYRKELSELTLQMLLDVGMDTEINKTDIIATVKSLCLNKRNFSRFYAMHNSYMHLEKVDEHNEATEKVILKMIAEELNAVASNMSASKKGILQIEQLISYIKVLSRQPLSQYYHVRKSMVKIMRNIMMIIGSDSWSSLKKSHSNSFSENSKEWDIIAKVIKAENDFGYKKIDTTPVAALQYQLYSIILLRLADLECTNAFTEENIRRDLRLYDKIKEKYFGKGYSLESRNDFYKFYEILLGTEIPTDETMYLRYAKAIKTATMYGENIIPSLQLVETYKSFAREICDNLHQDSGGEPEPFMDYITSFMAVDNTRILFDGIEYIESTLLQDCGRNILLDLDTPFFERLSSLNGKPDENPDRNLNTILNKIFKEHNDGCEHYHSPLYSFVKFWIKCYRDEPVNKIKAVLFYFVLITYVVNLESNALIDDTLPYRYEDICNVICKIMDCKMCYMISTEESIMPQILMASGYYAPYLKSNRILTGEDMERITSSTAMHLDKGAQKLFEGIYQINDYKNIFGNCVNDNEANDKTTDILIVHVGSELPSKQKNRKDFYIVLQYDPLSCGSSKYSTLAELGRVLFLRERLSSIMRRDCSTLLNKRFDCSYIRHTPGQKDKDSINILHLSDLHINSKDITFKDIKFNEPKEKVDLLAVTGDVADGKSGSAITMAKNYQYAETVLLSIAVSLWADNDERLPHDWKRRMLITTGNHDYASMNELDSKFDRRILSSGAPSIGESGTMTKFSHFIEFMQNFLDAPIDELIANDLNDFRDYRNLKLRCLILNSSSMVSPLRTNKIGISKVDVERLCNRRNFSPESETVVCLAHHSPKCKMDYNINLYSVSYNRGKYGETKLSVNGEEYELETLLENLLNSFVEDVCARFGGNALNFDSTELKKYYDFLIKISGCNNELRDALINIGCVSIDDLQKELNKICKSELMLDIEYYRSHYHDEQNERIANITNRILTNHKKYKVDIEVYEQELAKLNIDLCLAGHEHERDEIDVTYKTDSAASKYKTYVERKSFANTESGGVSIVGRILTITPAKASTTKMLSIADAEFELSPRGVSRTTKSGYIPLPNYAMLRIGMNTSTIRAITNIANAYHPVKLL